MEIIKNNKKYLYNVPNYNKYDYLNLANNLAELNIERVRN